MSPTPRQGQLLRLRLPAVSAPAFPVLPVHARMPPVPEQGPMLARRAPADQPSDDPEALGTVPGNLPLTRRAAWTWPAGRVSRSSRVGMPAGLLTSSCRDRGSGMEGVRVEDNAPLRAQPPSELGCLCTEAPVLGFGGGPISAGAAEFPCIYRERATNHYWGEGAAGSKDRGTNEGKVGGATTQEEDRKHFKLNPTFCTQQDKAVSFH